MGFLTGSKPKIKRVSNLSPQQQGVEKQLINAASGDTSGGGAFGKATDYYNSLFNEDNDTLNSMVAPEMRRFKEQIIPDLSEQFAGMGSGGLSSSGFRNAAIGAGTDLSERIGSLRAQLRQQGAQGLQNIGSSALENRSTMIEQPGSEGLLGGLGPVIGAGLSAFGGPLLGGLGSAASNWLTGSGNQQKGSTSPYGGLTPPSSSSSLPNFDWNKRR